MREKITDNDNRYYFIQGKITIANPNIQPSSPLIHTTPQENPKRSPLIHTTPQEIHTTPQENPKKSPLIHTTPHTHNTSGKS